MELLKFLLVLIPVLFVSIFLRTRFPKWGSFAVYLCYLAFAIWIYVITKTVVLPGILVIFWVALMYFWYQRNYKRSAK